MRTAAIAVVAAAAIMSCGGSNQPVSAPPAGTQLLVKNFTFPALTVKQGARVRVVNGDDENHTVTADKGEFDVGPVAPAKPQTFAAPAAAGSYAYHCNIHSSMHGTLVVQ